MIHTLCSAFASQVDMVAVIDSRLGGILICESTTRDNHGGWQSYLIAIASLKQSMCVNSAVPGTVKSSSVPVAVTPPAP
jgi:hypothetical protein